MKVETATPLFADVTDALKDKHVEETFNDFENQPLLRCVPNCAMSPSTFLSTMSMASGTKKLGEPRPPSYLGTSYSMMM